MVNSHNRPCELNRTLGQDRTLKIGRREIVGCPHRPNCLDNEILILCRNITK